MHDYTGIWCILIFRLWKNLCGNNDGILNAGVPSLERPYFLLSLPAPLKRGRQQSIILVDMFYPVSLVRLGRGGQEGVILLDIFPISCYNR